MSNFNLLCEPIKNGIVHKLGWRELTPIQELTIPQIIDGKNVVILAPTAGGKTEAAFFPVLNLLFQEQLEGTSILYVSPIKALLNNQEERLKRLSSFVYGSVFKWHGDVETGEKAKFFKEPSSILMITPESLEVILMSKKIDKDEFFKNIRCIVIDEIHSFANSERGIHLMALLERIQQYSKHDIQRIGLSATVGNPEEIGIWMRGSSKRDVVVINPPKEKKAKKIEIKVANRNEDFGKEITKRIYGKKSLLFSNSRSGAEGIKDLLTLNRIEAYVHHSSIDKRFRELAEEKFKIGTNTCIIATSTLELGIDIGDLDIVLQLEAPYSVSSFLQRLGRTGRRKDSIAHFIFFPTKPEKLLLAVAVLNLAISGYVEDVYVSNISYDLMFQQILTMTLSSFGISKDNPYNILNKAYSFSGINKENYDELIKYMIDNKFLQCDRGKVYIDDETEKRFGYQNFITLYSAFETNKEFTVRFKNRAIGTLERWFVNALGEDFQFVLAGKAWQTDKINYDKSVIYVVEAQSAMPPRWMSADGFLSFELAQEMLQILTSETKYPYINEYEAELIDDMRYENQAFGQKMNRMIIEEKKDGYDFYTFAGNKVNYTIAMSLLSISPAIEVKSVTWKGFRLKAFDKDLKPKYEDVFESIRKIKTNHNYFAENLNNLIERVPDISLSKYQKYLPSNFRKIMIADYVYDFKKTEEFVKKVDIQILKLI